MDPMDPPIVMILMATGEYDFFFFHFLIKAKTLQGNDLIWCK